MARFLSVGALCVALRMNVVVLRMNSVGADRASPASSTPAFTMARFVSGESELCELDHTGS